MKYIVKNTAIRHNGKYFEIGETVTFTSVPASLVNNLLLIDQSVAKINIDQPKVEVN